MENVVNIKLIDNMKIKIDTEDEEYLSSMKEEFTRYVPGFQFIPIYKSGIWNGKVCMIDKFHNTMPYGLLFDLIRIHKKNFPRNKLIIEPKIKKLFSGTRFRVTQDLSLKPYPYQKDCINSALKHRKGIIRSATSSGKSLIISYIIKTLLEKEKSGVTKALIVVPNIQLVEQFYKDMIEYNMDKDMLGRVYQKYKEWDKDIVIATWQTLKNNHDKLVDYQCIICDETHSCRALELKKILEKAVNCTYRLGFTGTMPPDDLDGWNVKGYLGPIIREYPSGFLAKKGYISKCNVKMLNVKYLQEEWEGEYNDIKNEIFVKKYRYKIIEKLTNSLDHNLLILVGKVEMEGQYLEKELKKNCNKEIVFLSGRDDVEVREKWRNKCKDRKNLVIIATYGIFAQGLNIPNLKYIMLAAPFKSKIRVLQSIGRSLRKHTDKKEGATIFDIVDQTKFFEKYGLIRLRYYDSEGFNIDEYLLIEGEEINIEGLLK